MQETEFQFAGAQGTELPARLWLPDGQPRLVLQISHGAQRTLRHAGCRAGRAWHCLRGF